MPRSSKLPLPSRSRHHDDRADARRRVSGPMELGLRRRAALRAVSRLRRPGRRCKRFVDAAHAHGLAVILDVVYNHLGPDGNYLKLLQPATTSARATQTDWGEALNFDGELRAGTRDFVIDNARYWMREFHLDGLRLDATQSIFDRQSAAHPRGARRAAARDSGAADARSSSSPRTSRSTREHLLPPEQGGYGLDAMWNDDFHHAARRADRHRAMATSPTTPAARRNSSRRTRGFLYQGQYYAWQKQTRGSPHTRPARRARASSICRTTIRSAITFLGDRVHATQRPARYRALTALTLLGAADTAAVHGPGVRRLDALHVLRRSSRGAAALVHKGRREFLSQFRAYADEATQQLRAGAARRNRRSSARSSTGAKWSSTRDALAFHRDLLQLRACDPVISHQDLAKIDGATLSEHAFVLRWFDDEHGDRLLVVNLDRELPLAPPRNRCWRHRTAATWQLLWSSEDPRYGGHGVTSWWPMPAAANGDCRRRAQCCWSRARRDGRAARCAPQEAIQGDGRSSCAGIATAIRWSCAVASG